MCGRFLLQYLVFRLLPHCTSAFMGRMKKRTGCILRVCSYFYWKRNNCHWRLSLTPVFQVVTPSVTPSSWSQDLPSPKIPWSWTCITCVFQISCYAFKSIISLGVFECRFVTVPVSMRGIYSFLHVFSHSYTNSVSEFPKNLLYTGWCSQYGFR